MLAYGHGFGLRYDLPLPLVLWIIGAASTVLLSFFFVAIFVRWNPGTEALAEAGSLRQARDLSKMVRPRIHAIVSAADVAHSKKGESTSSRDEGTF